MNVIQPKLPVQAQRARQLQDYLSRHSLASDAINRALDIGETDIAFVTGSVIDGVGDSHSDLDIYILTSREGFDRRSASFDHERKNQQEHREFGIIYCNVGGREFDAECHLTEKFVALFRELALLEPLDRDCLWRNFRGLGRFERAEAVELIHRFRIGVPLKNDHRFWDLHRTLHEWKYFTWNTHFHLIEAEDYIKGVKRSLSENDNESAYLKLQRLFDSLADAKIFASGESLDRWKWRLAKLRKLEDPEFLDLYLDIQIGGGERNDLRSRVNSLFDRAYCIHQQLFEQLRRKTEA